MRKGEAFFYLETQKGGGVGRTWVGRVSAGGGVYIFRAAHLQNETAPEKFLIDARNCLKNALF